MPNFYKKKTRNVSGKNLREKFARKLTLRKKSFAKQMQTFIGLHFMVYLCGVGKVRHLRTGDQFLFWEKMCFIDM